MNAVSFPEYKDVITRELARIRKGDTSASVTYGTSKESFSAVTKRINAWRVGKEELDTSYPATWEYESNNLLPSQKYTSWESPLFLAEFGKFILNTILSTPVQINQALDVGTGSGYFTFLLTKRRIQTTAVDIHKYAIELATENIQKNLAPQLQAYSSFLHDYFLPTPRRAENVDLIIMHPASFPCPRELSYKVPVYARSGANGIQEFITQLKYALTRLKSRDGHKIIFATLCGGNQNGPHLTNLIPAELRDVISLRAHLALKPIETLSFMRGYLGDEVDAFTEPPVPRASHQHLVFGTIQRACQHIPAVISHTPLLSRPWQGLQWPDIQAGIKRIIR